MSFADELRRAPAEKAAKKQQADDADWNSFIQLWYRHIKGECRHSAAGGYTWASASLADFIKELDSISGMIYDASGELREVKSMEGRLFKRLEERIAYRFSEYDSATDCLSMDDMFDLRDAITALLEADGLTVKEEHPSFRISKSGKNWYHLSLDIRW